MPVLDPESEAIIRRIEASIDVDDAWGAVQRRSGRARAATATRRLAAAAVVLVLLGGFVAIRAASDRSPSSLDVGNGGNDSTATAPTTPVDGGLVPTVTGEALPFLVPDAAIGTLKGVTVHPDPGGQADEAMRQELIDAGVVPVSPRTRPEAIYASVEDAGPIVAIETTDAQPTTVGTAPSTGGEPFTAGAWHGTMEVTGSPGHEVRTAVVSDGSASGELVVVTARQLAHDELVRLIAGLHRVGADGDPGDLRLADDSSLVLVSDTAPEPNNDYWKMYWDVDGNEIEVVGYREMGNPRFIERLAASPTMTRVSVGGRPGAVFESGGYTVFSWMPTGHDVIELGGGGTGPDAVARAVALAHGSRSLTSRDIEQQYPDLVLSPDEVPAAAAPYQQGTPLPATTSWSSFPVPFNPVNDDDLRSELIEFATCAWFGEWRVADAAGAADRSQAARAAIADASSWAVFADSMGGGSEMLARYASNPAPPSASTVAMSFGCR